MSSNYITSLHSLSLARQQSPQQSAPANRIDPLTGPDPIKGAVGRNEVAVTSGEDMPGKRAEAAKNVEKVESAVSQISDFVQNFQRDLQFSIDQESDRLVVKVVDSETQEVIRQIPSEEMLRIAKHLDSPESLILREQA